MPFTLKTILKLIFVFLFFSHFTFGQVKSNLELIDIFNMEYVSDPQISPDGNKIIYVRNFKDVMTDKNLSNLWIINFDGSNNRPLTTGNQNDFYPRWSHDGKKIIFKSNMSDGKMKLYLMWMDTKEAVPLTNTPKAPGQISWSHDDRFLAFTMFVPKSEESIVKMPKKPEGAKWNKPPTYITKLNYRGDGQGYIKGGNTQIFTLSIDGGTPRQWTSTDFDHGAPIWSKDGSQLFFSANFNTEDVLEPLNSEIYKLSLSDGNVTALTSRYGPDTDPKISPDGRKLAYIGFDDTYQGYQLTHAYILDIKSGKSSLISEDFDRDVQHINWGASGKGLYFQFDDEGDTKIGYMSLNGEVDKKVESLGGLSLGGLTMPHHIQFRRMADLPILWAAHNIPLT